MTLKLKNIFNKIKHIHYGAILKQLLEDYIKFPTIYIDTSNQRDMKNLSLKIRAKMHVAIVYLLLMVIASSFKATGAGLFSFGTIYG